MPTSWRIAAAGDFNGDGRDDLLWRSDSGSLSNWLGTAGGGFAPNDSNALTHVSTDWQVVGSATSTASAAPTSCGAATRAA